MRSMVTVMIFSVVAAGVAGADTFSAAGPSLPGQGGSVRADEYTLDDGVSENSVGLTAGGTFGFINQFFTAPGAELLTGISTTWGTPAFPGSSGVVAGQAFNVYVWIDGNGDANPTNAGGAPLVASAAGTVAAGSIDTDVFQTVPIAFDLTGITSFYVGVDITHPGGTYPAPLDQTAPQGRSWVAFGAPFPANLSGALNMDAIGLPGNWLVRANAIPEPASLALLGLILALRRR